MISSFCSINGTLRVTVKHELVSCLYSAMSVYFPYTMPSFIFWYKNIMFFTFDSSCNLSVALLIYYDCGVFSLTLVAFLITIAKELTTNRWRIYFQIYFFSVRLHPNDTNRAGLFTHPEHLVSSCSIFVFLCCILSTIICLLVPFRFGHYIVSPLITHFDIFSFFLSRSIKHQKNKTYLYLKK